jgi:hypothetical protein
MDHCTTEFGFPDLVQGVLEGIVEALTSRDSMPAAQKAARARSTAAMVLGLFPGSAMQLIVSGQVVLFHALTVEAARDVLHRNRGDQAFRALSATSLMGRTMSKNLDVLIRLQGKPEAGWLTPPDEEFLPDEMDAEPVNDEAQADTVAEISAPPLVVQGDGVAGSEMPAAHDVGDLPSEDQPLPVTNPAPGGREQKRQASTAGRAPRIPDFLRRRKGSRGRPGWGAEQSKPAIAVLNEPERSG